jgi:protease stability complex PrcB-like protein
MSKLQRMTEQMCIHRRLAAAILMMALAGCEGTRAISTGPSIPGDAIALIAPQPRAAAFDSAVKQFGYYSGLQSRERLVIRSAAAWDEMWSTLARNRSPKPALPAVDFATEMVILTAMGGRSTGGYSIEILGVFEHSDDVFVSVRETSPGSNCIVTQAFTAPVTAVVVPARSGNVLFSEVAVTRRC